MWGTGAAGAGQPAVRGCVGSSVSDAAHQPGPVGQFVSGLAHDPEPHPASPPTGTPPPLATTATTSPSTRATNRPLSRDRHGQDKRGAPARTCADRPQDAGTTR